MAYVSVQFNGVEERTVPLAKARMIIGRDAGSSDIHIDNLGVSRNHCALLVDGNNVKATDLGSSNGSFLNSERIEGEVQLKDGDEVTVGKHILIFKEGEVVQVQI